MKSKLIKITGLTVFLCLCLSCFQVLAVSDNGSYESYRSYDSYDQTYKHINNELQGITIPAADYRSLSGTGIIVDKYLDVSDAVFWNGTGSSISWEVDIPGESRYEIAFVYSPLQGDGLNIEMQIMIDGEQPFMDLDRFFLKITWQINTDFAKDQRGNDIMPEQSKKEVWIKSYITDSQGQYDDPYSFYFSEGRHTIEIKALTSDFVLREIRLDNRPEMISYTDYREAGKEKPTDEDPVSMIIDAEKPALVSDSIILPNYNHGSSATRPSDPVRMLLNTIGGTSWQSIGQWIEWEFDVPEDGLYKIGMRVRQNLKDGVTVSRRIYIDGEVPFSELSIIEFPFSPKWYIKMLGEQDPYLFYLSAGTHTLRMEVISGVYSSISRNIIDALYKLNSIYRNIIMITGTDPDIYRDYDLETAIPGFESSLNEIQAILEDQFRELTMIGKNGSETAFLNDLIVQIDDFLDKPDTIPRRLDRFHTNISSVSAWVLQLRNMPLEIDYIEILPENKASGKANGSFWDELSYSIRAIIGSFYNDYSVIGDYPPDMPTLKVWIQSGLDQAQIIKRLSDERFSPYNDISVKINLVQTGIIEATLAGKGPDAALYIPSAIPINLSSRKILVDLSEFDTYDNVEKRFMGSAITPYKYNGGVYALPITQNFPMMFYRTDIFEELGLSVPETWDDFYKLIPILQGKNLNIGMPDIFATLLVQRGGSIFNESLTSTMLDSKEALDAFYQWTEFFTLYGMPLAFDFFNRFRTGEMPLGIAPYTTYNQLYAAAPEIRNLWSMVPLPGMMVGKRIDNTVVGYGGESAIMLNRAEDKQKTWEFIDWFLSDDIQAAFGNNIEAALGELARYPTANTSAFKRLPWNVNQKDMLLTQWYSVREIEQIPASYYVTRNITNAFRRVVYYNEEPRYTLYLYNKQINDEITRKNEEMGKYGR